VKDGLKKAEAYLEQKQKNDGSWTNVSSTAWAMEGILALREKPENWIKNSNTPNDYLAQNQDADGSIKNDSLNNKIWETAYALASTSSKTWNEIMQKFDRPSGEKKPALIRVSLVNPIAQNTNASGQVKLIKKVHKSDGKMQKTSDTQNAQTKTIPTKRTNLFRRILGIIFGF